MRADCIDHGLAGNREGYATVKLAGKCVAMHRKVYCEVSRVSIADIAGKVVMHTCDNPRCINPEHLELGTRQDNMNDMVAKGRQAKGRAHGRAKLSELEIACIKQLWKEGKHKGTQLAAEFGCASSHISTIVHSR